MYSMYAYAYVCVCLICTHIYVYVNIVYMYVEVYLYQLLDNPCNVTRNLTLSGNTATVTFSSDNTKATFKCKLDQLGFKSCKYICVYVHLYVHVCMCIIYSMYII